MWTQRFNLTGHERFAAGWFLPRVDANRILAPGTPESGSQPYYRWSVTQCKYCWPMAGTSFHSSWYEGKSRHHHHRQVWEVHGRWGKKMLMHSDWCWDSNRKRIRQAGGYLHVNNSCNIFTLPLALMLILLVTFTAVKVTTLPLAFDLWFCW